MEIKRLLATKKHRYLAAGGAALLIGLGFGFKRYRNKNAAKDDTLVPVTRGDLEVHFRETGEIAAKDSVDTASKVSGRIIKLLVQEGDRVAAGQALAVIQPGRTETERYQPSIVTAPIKGIVMRYVKGSGTSQETRFAKVGDYVTGLFESNNPTYLMTVADLSTILVELRISEMDVLKLKERLPVTVNVDAIPETSFPARISMISPQAEKDPNGLKVFRVQVALDRVDPRLKPGMTARVDALLDKKESALKIPLAALFEEGGKSLAYVQTSGKPAEKKVETGLRTDTDAEILSGLSDKDKVYTEKPPSATP